MIGIASATRFSVSGGSPSGGSSASSGKSSSSGSSPTTGGTADTTVAYSTTSASAKQGTSTSTPKTSAASKINVGAFGIMITAAFGVVAFLRVNNRFYCFSQDINSLQTEKKWDLPPMDHRKKCLTSIMLCDVYSRPGFSPPVGQMRICWLAFMIGFNFIVVLIVLLTFSLLLFAKKNEDCPLFAG